MRDLLWIGVAGALGAVARYGVGVFAQRSIGTHFAYGTLIANVLGCFLLALLMTLGLSSELIPKTLKLALGTGFLGAFTTFSTFGYETLACAEKGHWRLAAANIAANLVVGLLAAWLGWTLGRYLLTRGAA